MSERRIGYLGVPGSYSHQAAARVEPEAKAEGFASFGALIEAVERGAVGLGVIPIENSTSGRIPEVHRLMVSMRLFIVGEMLLRIEHCLIVPRLVDVADHRRALEQVERVYSHPQGFVQCEEFIARSLPQAKRMATSDTASAVDQVCRDRDPTTAAIGSKFASDLYGGVVLSGDVGDRSENYTRFLALSPERLRDDAEADITTLIFQVDHRPGSLVKALAALERHGINVTKLETYMISEETALPTFYIDIGAGVREPALKRALDEFELRVRYVKFLGSYRASPQRSSQSGFLPPEPSAPGEE